MWILLGLLAFSLTNIRALHAWRPARVASVRVWLLWAWDLLRGHPDYLLFSAHVRPQLRAEEILFGGTVPTVWLPGAPLARLLEPAVVRLRRLSRLRQLFPGDLPRGRLPLVFGPCPSFAASWPWGHFSPLMAFATCALFPAAPPWLASERTEQLEPTTRSMGSILGHVPNGNFDALFEKGSQYANPVAAVPSLHAASPC